MVKTRWLWKFSRLMLAVLLVISGVQALAADMTPTTNSCPGPSSNGNPPSTDAKQCQSTEDCDSSPTSDEQKSKKQDAAPPGAWNACQSKDIDFRKTMALAVALALLYWLGAVTVRWHRIAQPTRELLLAQIRSTDAEFDMLPLKPDGAQRLKDLIASASGLVANRTATLTDFLFWSRGKEITGWGYVHEVQVQMAALLPLETVEARMTTVQARLKTASDPTATAVAGAVEKALDPESKTTLESKRALLAEALALDYDRTDSSFAYLLSWQNKVAWLVAFGLLLIITMTALAPTQSVFLLSGAVGGLLSRLARSLERNDVPTDYGASWATLFLSPVAGALAAWSGCLVSGLAVKAQVLGGLFDGLWASPTSTLAVGASLAFGFSEKLFSTVLSKLTDKTVGPQQIATPQSGGSSTTPEQKSSNSAPGQK